MSGTQSKQQKKQQGDGNSQRNGYPLEIAVHPPVDRKFICRICELILRMPMQGFCGHRFCNTCINHRFATKPNERYCPACKIEFEEDELSEDNFIDKNKIYIDNAIKRDFLKLEVKCLNEGCPWRGNLRKYEEHEENCEWRRYKCNCNDMVLLSQKSSHLENHCILREVTCVHCQKKVIFKFLVRHLEHECDKVPFDCEFCGRKNIPIPNREQHYRTECTTKTEKCPICSNYVKEGSVNHHIEQNIAPHLIRINTKLEGAVEGIKEKVDQLNYPIQAEELKNTIKAIGDRVSAIEVNPAISEGGAARVARRDPNEAGKLDMAAGGDLGAGASASADPEPTSDLAKKVENLGQRVAVFDSIGSVLNQEIMGVLHRVEQVESRPVGGAAANISSDYTRLQEKVRELENELRAKDQKISEVSIQCKNLETASYDGILLWKITDVARRRQEARGGSVNSIYSHPFYSSKTGYKMCARLYFNGDGMGRNTHLSLYFVVMRGEYDALLKWPFKQKVTLQLLDYNRREHVSDAFRPDPASTSFRQPNSNMNIASGCPLFCQLSKLDSPGTSLYIRDDSMFIKITVDVGDL